MKKEISIVILTILFISGCTVTNAQHLINGSSGWVYTKKEIGGNHILYCSNSNNKATCKEATIKLSK